MDARPDSLHTAVKRDDLTQVNALLTARHDANAVDGLGRTPLHIAAEKGFCEIATALVGAGANLDAGQQQLPGMFQQAFTDVTPTGMTNQENAYQAFINAATPFHIAAQHNQFDMLDHLQSLGADIHAVDADGNNALHHCAQRGGSTALIQKLVGLGLNIEARNYGGASALDLAASFGDKDNVQTLIDAGAEVSAHADTGTTALYHAAFHGHCEVIQILVSHTAQVSAPGFLGETPLHAATRNNHVDTILMLLRLGANREAPNVRGETAEDIARQYGLPKVLQVFVDYDAEISSRRVPSPPPSDASYGSFMSVVPDPVEVSHTSAASPPPSLPQ